MQYCRSFQNLPPFSLPLIPVSVWIPKLQSNKLYTKLCSTIRRGNGSLLKNRSVDQVMMDQTINEQECSWNENSLSIPGYSNCVINFQLHSKYIPTILVYSCVKLECFAHAQKFPTAFQEEMYSNCIPTSFQLRYKHSHDIPTTLETFQSHSWALQHKNLPNCIWVTFQQRGTWIWGNIRAAIQLHSYCIWSAF